ncbi:hypothetical protein MSAN_00877200 [Mycena sanguinolenta]|uniref:Uncharacterized protein n=1 Tax=Mycena sanguinolenta TaxID=230812 RepID=A0A8H7DB98_9AGAR|nr:hypothetical protein MSAN_00877200 [Mycena sanguinolenta]
MLDDPRLPPELELRIFRIAALARPTSIPTFMLVARRIKCWVESLLYRVVFLSDAGIDESRNLGLPTFAVDAFEQRSLDCLPHVRYLFIHKALEQGTLQKWLLACTGVTNLYAQFVCTPAILASLGGFTNVQYLTIDVRTLMGDTSPLPCFLSVTHLELLDFTAVEENVDRVCPNISLIPHLTHIALNSDLDTSLSHAALCANTQLQCIVFLSTEEPSDGGPLLDDNRFVCIEEGFRYHMTSGKDFHYVEEDSD